MLAVTAITLPIINNIQFDIYNINFLDVSVMQKRLFRITVIRLHRHYAKKLFYTSFKVNTMLVFKNNIHFLSS